LEAVWELLTATGFLPAAAQWLNSVQSYPKGHSLWLAPSLWFSIDVLFYKDGKVNLPLMLLLNSVIIFYILFCSFLKTTDPVSHQGIPTGRRKKLV